MFHSSELVNFSVGGGSDLTEADSTVAIAALFVDGPWVRMYNSSSISFSWVILGGFGGLFISRQG